MRFVGTSLFAPLAAALALAAAPALTRAVEPTELAPPRPLVGTVEPPSRPADPPEWLPRYDLDVQLNVNEHCATVRQRVTYFHRHQRPARELVFNVHSHYKVPDDQVGFLAKTLEILRIPPNETLELEGHACDIKRITWIGEGPNAPVVELPFKYRANDVNLDVPLPRPLNCGQAITVELEFLMHLPQKQGRWGQWNGVTYLTNWLPVLAVHDEEGWHPTPFIPWHQPFYNETGLYTARIIAPADQKYCCSAPIKQVTDLGDGTVRIEYAAALAREFSFLCSARYCETVTQCGPVKVRCLHFAEHEFHARHMVRIASEAIAYYSQWFGPYPHPEFTIVESYFGWLGNECSNFIMVDDRVFNMPHLAVNYMEYLISHETCHQWWYNLIGTNGFHETWMDEGMATYFSHRVLDRKLGKNNTLLNFPDGLKWLPNIERQSYRYYGLCGTIARGEAGPVIQDMDKFDHIVNLFSMCYDRGSKVVGLIEDRLGEAAFLDFMHIIYNKYRYRILLVADFQRELEAYTHHSWQEFFDHWLYKGDMVDWSVEKVEVAEADTGKTIHQPFYWVLPCLNFVDALKRHKQIQKPVTVTVLLKQKGQFAEQTTVGFSMDGTENFQVRVPISSQVPKMQLEDPPSTVESLGDNCVRVQVTLPCEPTQVAVDPDQLLVDSDVTNNYWKPRCRVRVTPLYTLFDDTDLTDSYDRWNLNIGPWVFDNAYYDPWYTRSAMIGVRAGLYRTQRFSGGAYLAYRSDYRDIVAGVDGLIDHWPESHTQIGFSAEASLYSVYQGNHNNERMSVYERYIFQYGDSLYLLPMHYLELFQAYQNNALPTPRTEVPGAIHFDQTTMIGLHYHLDYLTPYWDPEGGFKTDVTLANGTSLGKHEDYLARLDGQFSFVKSAPEGLGWFSSTRFAFRAWGGTAIPGKGELFTLGGDTRFRGFDLRDRQGSQVWLGSVEWRVPLATHLTYDLFDHVVGIRNVYGVGFYDVGDVYANGHQVGPIAHAVGGGVRVDTSIFSFVERVQVRFDVAKTVGTSRATQFWFGVGVPF